MKNAILSFIFIPIILLFALLFFLHMGILFSNPNSSSVTFWNGFKRMWMTSVPFYGFILSTLFYVVLLIKSPKQTLK